MAITFFRETEKSADFAISLGVSQVAIVARNPPANLGDMGSIPGLG